jgi:putative hydrolase of the HAD superfamily
MAITLDANGVLVLPDPVAIRESLEPFAVQPTEPDYLLLNKAFAAALGVALPDQERAGAAVAATYLTSRWVASPGAARAVRRLAATDVRLAVISNTTHGEMAELLSREEICNVGEMEADRIPVFDSQVVGLRKPDPEIFHLALRALDVDPRQAVHVGDSRVDDVHGAEAIGMSPIHIDPLQRCGHSGHPHRRSLSEWVDTLFS